MSELSNAVTVLIARMETHPEDFEYGKKFGSFAEAMWGLVGADDEIKAPLWFLSDADKEALRDAWAKVHYSRWEKDIMEKVFDEGYYERMDAIETQKRQYEQQMRQARMAAQQTALAGRGQITPMHNNANQGLLGQAGTAFQGLFK